MSAPTSEIANLLLNDAAAHLVSVTYEEFVLRSLGLGIEPSDLHRWAVERNRASLRGAGTNRMDLRPDNLPVVVGRLRSGAEGRSQDDEYDHIVARNW
jgi:hypothetical protein